ncbi:MAG: glycosyltransferase [Desulfovibrio sp.]|nr:glycosyltransferase [Desulfovibrio sp.]
MKRDNSPVPLVFLLEDLDFGGTQRQTLELASRLDRRRFEPLLVTLHGGSGDLLPEAASRGLKHLSLTDGPVFRVSRALPALWQFLARERPPLLQLLTVLPNIWGRIFGRLLRLPAVIACCRSLTAAGDQHERLLHRQADAHICNAEAVRDILKQKIRIPGHRVFYIPNGVDTEYFRPPDAEAERPSVLCTARLAPVKNHALLLEAFARVLRDRPDAELHLAGDGVLREKILEMSRRTPLRGKVFLHGNCRNVRELLHKAQLFVLASDNEGTPNAVLEAMSCALPVLATNVGGNAEAVLHERTGLLFPAGDPAAAADGMLRMLNDAGERARFGRAGRERALEAYSWRAMVEKHEEVYERTLHGRAGKRR